MSLIVLEKIADTFSWIASKDVDGAQVCFFPSVKSYGNFDFFE